MYNGCENCNEVVLKPGVTPLIEMCRTHYNRMMVKWHIDEWMSWGELEYGEDRVFRFWMMRAAF